jgi:hypothetical protein
MMPQMPQTRLGNCDRTTAELIEGVARETAKLPNRHAWPEILAKLKAAGRSPSQSCKLREQIWLVRKENAQRERSSETGRSP